MMILRYRVWSYVFSGALFVASCVAFAVWGLNPGIDFTGGAISEVEFLSERPPVEAMREALRTHVYGK